MAPTRAIAALLLLAAAIGGASASRLLLQNCPDEKYAASTPKATQDFLRDNYGEKPVAKYADTCASGPNLQCQQFKAEGCSLWALAQKHCNGDEQPFAAKYNFVYTGTASSSDHIIGVPCTGVRGIEDVPANKNNALAATRAMWPQMWADVTGGTVQGKRGGYPAAGAALVINTPSNREYHQLHIHAGTRTSQFDKCVAKMSYKPNEKWQRMTCKGLVEGGGSGTGIAAQLLYKTVKSLDGVWAAYTQGVAVAPGAGGLAIGGTPTSKYHVGALVTSPPSKLQSGQWFVVLYAPPKLSAPPLGRGSFLVGK